MAAAAAAAKVAADSVGGSLMEAAWRQRQRGGAAVAAAACLRSYWGAVCAICRVFFGEKRGRAGEEGKISSDLKKCNATWSIDRLRVSDR